MDTDLIKSFVVVARHLSFTLAAEDLGTTQPLLSRAMRRLESIVGEDLFNRKNRQIALTPSGVAFLAEAQGILDQVNIALRRASAAGHGAKGLLRLGYVSTSQFQTFHRGIRKFRKLHPDVSLEFRLMTAVEQANALRAGELDAGLLQFTNFDRRELTWKSVGRSWLILAIPSDWPIKTGKPVELSLLRDRPFVFADPEIAPDMHAAQVACCNRAGFQPREMHYCRDANELRFLVAAGVGVAFVPDNALFSKMDGIHYAPIHDPPSNLFFDFYIVWLPRRSSSRTLSFIDCMTSETYAISITQKKDGFHAEWQKARFD
jgi:DNA-binding transcriptional LysR family regulator